MDRLSNQIVACGSDDDDDKSYRRWRKSGTKLNLAQNMERNKPEINCCPADSLLSSSSLIIDCGLPLRQSVIERPNRRRRKSHCKIMLIATSSSLSKSHYILFIISATILMLMSGSLQSSHFKPLTTNSTWKSNSSNLDSVSNHQLEARQVTNHHRKLVAPPGKNIKPSSSPSARFLALGRWIQETAGTTATAIAAAAAAAGSGGQVPKMRGTSSQVPIDRRSGGSFRYELLDGRAVGGKTPDEESTSLQTSDRLNLIQSQLAELRRQLELELSVDQRQVTLGSPCFNSSDCSNSIARSHCKLDNFTCACLPYHVAFNSTTCLPPALLGYECLIDAQCQRKVPDSHCSKEGVCACNSKLVTYRKDKCLPASKINDYCLTDGQCQLSDRHSHCKWKIANVYGVCKCPPNYKLVTYPSATGNWSKTTATKKSGMITRCAPRLGDSCFDSDECQLGAENSLCREPRPADTSGPKWRTGNENSGKRCVCASGYRESPNRMQCLLEESPLVSTPADVSMLGDGGFLIGVPRQPPPPSGLSDDSTTTTAPQSGASLAPLTLWPTGSRETQTSTSGNQTTATVSSWPMDIGKHHYELMAPQTEVALNSSSSQEFDIRTLSQSATTQMSSTMATSLAMGSSTLGPISTATSDNLALGTSKPTTATLPSQWSTVQRKKKPATNQTGSSEKTTQVQAASGAKVRVRAKVSSLGKKCDSRAECQATDLHSDCVGGRCECLRPTSSCSANSTGCHPDTFQCRNGQCISWYFVCDQFKNCDDGSDEDECRPSTCPPEAFQCADGACLARGKLCNGKADCADGSDELQCNPSSNRVQPSDSGDGISGGAKGACHPRAFQCDDGQCLPPYVFCNAVEDCADGSDERERICERPWSRRKWSSPAATNSSQSSSSASRRKLTRRPPALTTDSPLVKSDRASIDRMLLAARTPEGRGRRLQLARRPPGNEEELNEAHGDDFRDIRDFRRARHWRQRRQRESRSHSAATPLPAPTQGECPKSAFTCRNGKCRSSAILCSGIDGCGDNSDEDRCQVCRCAPPA